MTIARGAARTAATPAFTPTDIANCELYLDVEEAAYSDAGTTPCTVGDAIAQLSDLSGNDRHATVPSGTGPTFTLIQGVGAARHGNNYLETSSFLDSSFNTAITVVRVCEPTRFGSVLGGDEAIWTYHDGSAGVESTAYNVSSLSPGSLAMTLTRRSNRVEVYRYNGSTQKLRVAGPDLDTESSSATTGNLGATGIWTVGTYPGNAFGPYSGFIRAEIIYKRSLTDGEVDSLVAWALAKFAANSTGALSSGGGDAVVVCDGNSLTSGVGGTAYPTQLDTLLGAGWTVSNQGVGGQYMGDMLTDRSRTLNIVDAQWSASASRNICVYFEGANEVNLGAGSGSQAFQRHKDYGLRRRYKGWEVLVCTIPPSGTSNATQETERQALNTLLRANWADFADGLVDLAADPVFDAQADASNGTYYDADTIHLTTAGYAVIAGLVKTAIDNL